MVTLKSNRVGARFSIPRLVALAWCVMVSAGGPCTRAAEPAKSEEDKYYSLVTLPLPPGVQLEPGALEFMPDGKLAVSNTSARPLPTVSFMRETSPRCVQ